MEDLKEMTQIKRVKEGLNMKVKINNGITKTESKSDMEFKIENINSIRFEDVKGENTYIHIFNRRDDNTFIESYKTLDEGVHLCPICGKYNKDENCTCSGKPVIEDEDIVIDIFEESLSLPYVDIYINDELIRKAI